jgi:hypothetical protein
MKNFIFWYIKPCIPVVLNLRFGGKYSLHFHGRRVSLTINSMKKAVSRDSRNVGRLSADYTALYPRRLNSSRLQHYAGNRLELATT